MSLLSQSRPVFVFYCMGVVPLSARNFEMDSLTFKLCANGIVFGGQQYTSNRLRTLGELKTKGRNPYPHKFERSMSIPEYVKEFSSMGDGQHLEAKSVSVAGMPCYL